MDIKAIQKIRNADQADKFTMLLEEVCGSGAAEREVTILSFQDALHQLERYRFAASPGYHLTVVSPDSSKKPARKVIVTENEFGRVIKKEYTADCYAYSFLRDYLGLDGKEPLSPEQMAIKYPSTTKQGGEVDLDWYDAIARILIKGIRRQIYGPGKKLF